MLYLLEKQIGTESVIESINTSGPGGPYKTTNASKLFGYHAGDTMAACGVGRVKESVAAQIDPSMLTTDPAIANMAGGDRII